MSVDAFEQAWRDWIRGIHAEERVRREDANLTAFVNGLQKRGHTITYDYLERHIFVDAASPRAFTITMREAREMNAEEIIKWIEERQKHD